MFNTIISLDGLTWTAQLQLQLGVIEEEEVGEDEDDSNYEYVEEIKRSSPTAVSSPFQRLSRRRR
jgi:hypothetical protein